MESHRSLEDKDFYLVHSKDWITLLGSLSGQIAPDKSWLFTPCLIWRVFAIMNNLFMICVQPQLFSIILNVNWPVRIQFQCLWSLTGTIFSFRVLHCLSKTDFVLTTYLSSFCQVKGQTVNVFCSTLLCASIYVCFIKRMHEGMTMCFMHFDFCNSHEAWNCLLGWASTSRVFKAGAIFRRALWSAASSSLHWEVQSRIGTQDWAYF